MPSDVRISPMRVESRLLPIRDGDRSHTGRSLLLGVSCYLVLAVGMWWHLWNRPSRSVTTCGCGDASQFTWFLGWVAHAIAHGANPFFTTAMGYPHGVNLLTNTSVTALGAGCLPQ